MSVALGIVMTFLFPLSIVAVPVMPIPAAFITSRHGVRAGLLVSLLTGLLCLGLTLPLVGVYAGILIFMLTLVAGTGAGLALRMGISEFRLLIAMAAIFSVTLFLWLGSLLLIVGQGPVDALQSLVDYLAATSGDFYQSLGMSQEEIDVRITQARDFASALPYLAPAVILVMSIVFSSANVAIARRVFDRLSQPFPRDFAFRDFRVHWAFVYMLILGLLFQFLAPYASETYSFGLENVGANLYIVAEVLFFIQGIAIASFFLWAYKVSGVKRTAVYICLVMLELFLSLTSWMGLFDTWFNYRKRFIRKKLSGQ